MKNKLSLNLEDFKGTNIEKGFTNKKLTVDLQDMIDEHKELVSTLKSPSRRDDKKELREQSEELRNYQKQAKR